MVEDEFGYLNGEFDMMPLDCQNTEFRMISHISKPCKSVSAFSEVIFPNRVNPLRKRDGYGGGVLSLFRLLKTCYSQHCVI